MKVLHTVGINYMSGKQGNSVFMHSGITGMSYMRAFKYPVLTAQNSLRGAELANLKTMFHGLSAAYRAEFDDYVSKYKNLENYGSPNSNRANSSFAVFISMMWNYFRADEAHIDLTTITILDFKTLYEGQMNIPRQVDTGMLLAVPDYASYSAEMYV